MPSRLSAPVSALLLAHVLAAATSGRAADSLLPGHGSQHYDVRHYDLVFRSDPSRHSIAARARLTIRAKQDLRVLRLDFASLTVDRVSVQQRGTRFSTSARKLIVTPSRPIPRGTRFRLAVSYHGAPRSLPDPTAQGEGSGPLPRLGWINYGEGSFVVSEPVGASTFFPCNDLLADKATYSFSITVPKPFAAVANGEPAGIVDLGSAREFRFEMRQPMASWLATLHINRYAVTRQSFRGIPIRHYTTAGVSAAEVKRLRETPRMMAFLTRLLGAAYPFASYGSVTINDPNVQFALETQTMSTFSPGSMDRATIMHELAHQWFGNAVTFADWSDIWLAEGPATYFQLLYTHREPAAFEKIMGAYYDFVVQTKAGPVVAQRIEDLFSTATYTRGALTLYALRAQVGNRKFLRILRTYYRRHQGGNATTRDFIACASEVSRDPAVAGLLNAWLYEKDVPPLQFTR